VTHRCVYDQQTIYKHILMQRSIIICYQLCLILMMLYILLTKYTSLLDTHCRDRYRCVTALLVDPSSHDSLCINITNQTFTSLINHIWENGQF